MPVKPSKTNANKKAMIEALKKSFGIVSTACENVGISRVTHYEWLKTDNDYAAAVDEVNQRTGDFVEGRLLSKIKDGDTTAIIFYSKTKLKKRGYVERNELDLAGRDAGPPIVVKYIDGKEEDDDSA